MDYMNTNGDGTLFFNPRNLTKQRLKLRSWNVILRFINIKISIIYNSIQYFTCSHHIAASIQLLVSLHQSCFKLLKCTANEALMPILVSPLSETCCKCVLNLNITSFFITELLYRTGTMQGSTCMTKVDISTCK